jgi:hypothetical protein
VTPLAVTRSHPPKTGDHGLGKINYLAYGSSITAIGRLRKPLIYWVWSWLAALDDFHHWLIRAAHASAASGLAT